MALIVSDTGEGIPDEHLPKVCERFHRVDAAPARTDSGTALELTICQSMVQAHYGRLEIRGEVGNGITAPVWLPRFAAPQILAQIVHIFFINPTSWS